MATIRNIAQYKEDQQRLALLALLADRQPPGGDCLSAEQLAALVEGTMDSAAVERCLAHLAKCDHCSTLWLQLDQERQRLQRQQEHSKRRRLVKKPRMFTMVGSVFAAAASIAVFLTITTRLDQRALLQNDQTQPLRQQELTLPPTTTTQSPTPQAMSRHHGALEGQAEGFEALTHPPQPPAGQKSADRTMERKSRKEVLQTPATGVDGAGDTASGTGRESPHHAQSEDMAIPAPPKATPSTLMAPAIERAAGSPAPLTFADWQQHLRVVCRQQPDADTLASLAAQSRRLLDATPANNPLRKPVAAILARLEGQGQPAEKCRDILTLLDMETAPPSP
jgi:hypothetical protein